MKERRVREEWYQSDNGRGNGRRRKKSPGGGGGGVLICCCLGHLTIDHASLSRRSKKKQEGLERSVHVKVKANQGGNGKMRGVRRDGHAGRGARGTRETGAWEEGGRKRGRGEAGVNANAGARNAAGFVIGSSKKALWPVPRETTHI